MTALGLIETKGLLAAIEAADAMLKAADVRLQEKTLAGGGLVTIIVAGKVASVKAAVDAAAASIRRIPGTCLVSQHVIARPDAELKRIVATGPPAVGLNGTPDAEPVETIKDVEPVEKVDAVERNGTPGAEPEEKPGAPSAAPMRYEIPQLNKMGLNRLRQIAETLEGLSVPREKIASTDRKTLLEALINANRQLKE